MLFLGFANICCERKGKSKVFIKQFSKESYYETTPEVSSDMYCAILTKMNTEDKDYICSKLKTLDVDNLTADFVVEVVDWKIDSIQLMGVVAFDQNGILHNDTAVQFSGLVSRIMARDLIIVSHKTGSYPVRVQLERFCEIMDCR
jgi:hypothetical protein